jgi:hypothetical protein
MSEIREYRVERRGQRGCLWGCLAVLVIVLAPLLLAWGYSAWFLYTGFRESPMVRTIVEMTRRDGLARQVLGAPITVVGVEGNAFSYMPGTGTRNRYVLRVEGPKGTGTLDVSGAGNGTPKIDSMILTGPDGRRYDLLKDAPLPGGPVNRPPGDTI